MLEMLMIDVDERGYNFIHQICMRQPPLHVLITAWLSGTSLIKNDLVYTCGRAFLEAQISIYAYT